MQIHIANGNIVGFYPDDLPLPETLSATTLVASVAGWTAPVAAPGKIPDMSAPAPTADILKSAIAYQRLRAETAGITVNTKLVPTDRGSQAMINGAYAYSQVNPTQTISYKTAAGFVTMDAPTIKSLASAVGAHVQACFVAEAAAAAAVDAGTISTYADVLALTWPTT